MPFVLTVLEYVDVYFFHLYLPDSCNLLQNVFLIIFMSFSVEILVNISKDISLANFIFCEKNLKITIADVIFRKQHIFLDQNKISFLVDVKVNTRNNRKEMALDHRIHKFFFSEFERSFFCTFIR